MPLEVHALTIIIKHKSPVRCSYLLATQDTLLWPLAATLLLFQEYTGGQVPGLVSKVPAEPAVLRPCVETSKAMSTQWSLQGSVHLVMAAGCYSGVQSSASVILSWSVLGVV